MNRKLFTEQVIQTAEKELSCELKEAIIERHFNMNSGAKELNINDISYLSGLADAGIKDADWLIEQIGKYGKIRLVLV